MNDDIKLLSEMPILRKRFDDNPRKRFRNSGMIEAKRARFKDMKTGIDHPRERSEFSEPVEAREEPFKPVSDSSDPKTSEFAYFKRLKQGVGHTSRINSVNRESIQMRNSGPSKNGREFGEPKFINDVEAPIFDKKLSTLDVGSSLHPEDVAIRSSDVHSRVDNYTERLNPAPAIKTPTAIDLDSFVSASGTASVNSGSQLKDGDIFLSKRIKLQQLISKTLFLEADNLSKEYDVVSLLLSRLLPEGSSKIPSERKDHMEPQLKDKRQENLRDSSFELGECWDGTQKLVQADVDNFLDGGVSSAYWGTHPSCQINEANILASTCVDTMLLGFKEGSIHGSSSNEHWSDMFVDRNLLTSGNKTSSNIFKNEVDGQCYGSFVSDQSRTFSGRTHSYELPTICYDRFAEDCPIRNRLGFPDSWRPESSERFESTALCNFRDTANLDEFPDNYQRRYCLEYREERIGSRALVNLRDSAELNEPKIIGEHSPLLLTWGSDDTNMKPFRDLNDVDHELYSPPSWNKDNQFGLDSSTSRDIYQSPSSFMLHSSSDILHDHTGPRSSWAPITLLCDPDQLNPYDDRLSKDVFTGSCVYVISEAHNHYMGSVVKESVVPHVGALLISQGLDSNLGLKSESLPDCIQEQDMKGLMIPQLKEHYSLINVDSPGRREVSFPSQLHRISWLDTAVETSSSDELQISSTWDNLS
ncbi:uncharacterized protein LOC141598749 [Silene latifolia]|uniref:uncharacterized protein LOC141598749 n=1 Tax=Silene latifolia TaxID=37657 RepID=UPI003D76D8E9